MLEFFFEPSNTSITQEAQPKSKMEQPSLTRHNTALHSLCLTLTLTTTHATHVLVLVQHLYPLPCARPVQHDHDHFPTWFRLAYQPITGRDLPTVVLETFPSRGKSHAMHNQIFRLTMCLLSI
jgi:hypothetical protein